MVELIVVVLIVGLLSAVMIPGYNKSVESSKADDAAAVVLMVGQANRMFRIDNNNYVDNGTLDDSMNTGNCTAGARNISQLMRCNYLGGRKWTGLPYVYQAGTSISCGISGAPSGIACAKRDSAARSPYDTWGYVMLSNGVLKGYRSGVEIPLN